MYTISILGASQRESKQERVAARTRYRCGLDCDQLSVTYTVQQVSHTHTGMRCWSHAHKGIGRWWGREREREDKGVGITHTHTPSFTQFITDLNNVYNSGVNLHPYTVCTTRSPGCISWFTQQVQRKLSFPSITER